MRPDAGGGAAVAQAQPALPSQPSRAAGPWPPSAVPVGTPQVLVGTDLVAVERLETMLTNRPGMARRVFTEHELAYCAGRARRRMDHLAARFAAKEAVMKALGTGASGGVEWTDIEVVNDLNGRPAVRLHGVAAAVARRRGVRQTEISLSHTAGLAMAHAVFVCAADAPDEEASQQDGGTQR